LPPAFQANENPASAGFFYSSHNLNGAAKCVVSTAHPAMFLGGSIKVTGLKTVPLIGSRLRIQDRRVKLDTARLAELLFVISADHFETIKNNGHGTFPGRTQPQRITGG
jgi:hypothetical protein